MADRHSKQFRKTDRYEQCVICLQDFQEIEIVTMLPCMGKHMFHLVCIERHFTTDYNNLKCPLCKDDVSKIVLRLKKEEDLARSLVAISEGEEFSSDLMARYAKLLNNRTLTTYRKAYIHDTILYRSLFGEEGM